MNIFVSAGLGEEDSLLSVILRHYPSCKLSVAGGKWDVNEHRFPSFKTDIKNTIHYYYDHETVLEWETFDLFIDMSGNLKSSFLLSNQAASVQKRCIVISPHQEYTLWDSGDSNTALSQYFDYTHPAPPVTKTAPNITDYQRVLQQALHLSSPFATLISRDTKDIRPYLPLDVRWELGQMQDVCAVSCGDKTVSLTPMEERRIDLACHASLIEPYCEIKRQSPFFLQFIVAGLDCMLFKQGRLMVNGSENKNDGKYIYREFVGS